MILAIDPGQSGAVALYDPDLDFLYTEALPMRWRMVNDKKKTELDIPAFVKWLDSRKDIITKVMIEHPTALPNGGVTSQFNFAKMCGHLEGIVFGMLTGIAPIHTVHPTAWKNALDVPSDKRRSRGRAAKFFPLHAHLFERADSEGQAEAAMLAYYAATVTAKPVKMNPGKAPANKKKPKTFMNSEGFAGKRKPGRPKKAA